MTAWLRSLLATLTPAGIVAGRIVGRFWSAIRGHLVTAAALALFSWAGFAIYLPLGLAISAVSLLVLDRKVELDR